MYLGGSGGTGKSRVINAFVDFSRRWHSTTSVVVTASSGVAAVLIGGCTIHGALGIQQMMTPKPPSTEMITAWSEVGVMLIDEFSMVKADLYDLLDSRLRLLKANNKLPFGGLHMIYFGDFYQLPPVGSSIYKAPTRYENDRNDHAMAAMRGREKWLTLTTDTIELEENHRQTDQRWAASQQRWRINQPSQEDINDVNSRYLQSNLSTTQQQPPQETIAAVPENITRENGIRYCESHMLSTLPPIDPIDYWRHRGILLVQAKVTRAEGHQVVQPPQIAYAQRVAAKEMKTVSDLYCTMGASYMMGSNIDVTRGIANGTVAKLYDIILAPDAQIRIINVQNSNQCHAVYADEVTSMIFKHTSTLQQNATSFATLPIGCFPITSISHSVKCKLGATGSSFKVKVTQLPCVSALVLTGHKIQGRTLDAVILGALSNIHKSGRSGWIYVILSRVRTLNGLFLLTLLETDPKKYKPRTDVMTEMNRLHLIEKSTLARLEPC